jgi:O-antigen/teichoic acid export membrane protein
MRFRVGRAQLRWGFSTLPELLRFGLKLTPGFLADGVSNESSTWILASITTVPVLGAFSRAWMIARRGLELTYRVTEMLFPTLVERRLGGDGPGFDRALVDSLRYVAIAMLLPAAVAAGAASPIMSIYGHGFKGAAGAFAYLAFVPGVITLAALQSHALYTEGQGLRASCYSLLRMVATVLSGVFLTRSYGVTGMGAAMLIGACTQLIPLTVKLPSLLEGALVEQWKPREIVSLVAAGLAGFVLSRLLSAELSNLLALLLAPTLGLLAAAGVFVVLGGLQVRDRERGVRVSRALSARGSLAYDRLRRSPETF